MYFRQLKNDRGFAFVYWVNKDSYGYQKNRDNGSWFYDKDSSKTNFKLELIY